MLKSVYIHIFLILQEQLPRWRIHLLSQSHIMWTEISSIALEWTAQANKQWLDQKREKRWVLKNWNGESRTAVFTETAILCMFEGKDYKNADPVEPIFKKIVDVCCGYSKTTLVTDVFIQFADLKRAIREKVTHVQISRRGSVHTCYGKKISSKAVH